MLCAVEDYLMHQQCNIWKCCMNQLITKIISLSLLSVHIACLSFWIQHHYSLHHQLISLFAILTYRPFKKNRLILYIVVTKKRCLIQKIFPSQFQNVFKFSSWPHCELKKSFSHLPTYKANSLLHIFTPMNLVLFNILFGNGIWNAVREYNSAGLI